MAIKNLIAGGAFTALVCWAAPSFAIMSVIDTASIAQQKIQVAKLVEEIEVLRTQLDTLSNMKSQIDEQLKAFGEFGNINIPTINFTKISGQLMSDMSCLVPDYESLMPNISTDEIDIGSICSRGDAYKQGLMVDPKALKDAPTWKAKGEIRREIKKNRIKAISDATTKGLAQADMALEASVETIKAAQEYKAAGSRAKTVNDRLQVLIEVSSAQLLSQAREEQLVAQLLKVMSSLTLQMGVPVSNDLATEESGS